MSLTKQRPAGKRHNETTRAVRNAGDRTPVIESAEGVKTRFRPIGNSRGVILNNQLLAASGRNADVDIVIHAGAGAITIVQAKQTSINTNLSTWDAQFKACNKKELATAEDLFGGMKNKFDDNEW